MRARKQKVKPVDAKVRVNANAAGSSVQNFPHLQKKRITRTQTVGVMATMAVTLSTRGSPSRQTRTVESALPVTA